MQDQTLVAVIVTFNRIEQLKITLAAVLAQGAVLQACVVFDNGSTDGTAELLAQQNDPRLLVHRAHENLGGAGGFAAAMKLATARFDPDWIVLMDDDARPDTGALARFVNDNRATAAAWAAKVNVPSGGLCEVPLVS